MVRRNDVNVTLYNYHRQQLPLQSVADHNARHLLTYCNQQTNKVPRRRRITLGGVFCDDRPPCTGPSDD